MKYKELLKIFLLLLFPLVFAIVTILVRFDIVRLLNICLGFILPLRRFMTEVIIISRLKFPAVDRFLT